ncbi:NADH-quinone oxidoreductase subunit C [Aestuariimicrobium ganziense]|uniref:NADH-quinone oxidoreductase subunit C n=1 Tax=Aestuariimicrobium ganziense TaxID=2773677 RepID=UPI0019428411|nr:NADH-quinone oxidoreductase subunit C [Aestuariimicrobium ganziense]
MNRHGDEIVQTTSEQWRDAVAAALAEGFSWFDSLIGIDEVGRPSGGDEEVRVVVRLVRHDPEGDPQGRQLHVRIPRELDQARLDSIGDLVAGAAWYERETHDMFGVSFTGGDDRPLLWHLDTPRHPLRKDELLAARLETPWPGAKDPDDDTAQASRRRTLPPGVPDPQLLDDPSVTPAELVASLGRARSRRARR